MEKRCRCWGGECGRSSREDVQVCQASLMELVTSYARHTGETSVVVNFSS